MRCYSLAFDKYLLIELLSFLSLFPHLTVSTGCFLNEGTGLHLHSLNQVSQSDMRYNRETEIQKSQATFPKSHSRQDVQPEFHHRLTGSRGQAHNYKCHSVFQYEMDITVACVL